MPIATVGNVYTCNIYGILGAKECQKFLKDHPCLTPTAFSGPHSPACLSQLWKKAIGKDKGSSEPCRVVGGSIKIEQIKEIAENKMNDLNASSIDGAIEMVKGSARSMGMEIIN